MRSESSDIRVALSTVERLAELAVIKDGSPDIAEALTRAAQTTHELLSDCAGVSVTVRQSGQDFTFAASNDLTTRLDHHQYDHGYGPCVDALDTDSVISSPDLSRESRWPGWTSTARAAGIESMRSVPLGPVAKLPAVMNLYGSRPGAFDDDVAHITGALVAHSAALLSNVVAFGAAARLTEQLREAMASRAVIEQAKGVLIAILPADVDTAWAYLVRLSQTRQEKLRDVAKGIVSRAAQGQLTLKPGEPEAENGPAG